MPEGPSILILKEKIERLHLIGEQLLGVTGNAEIDMVRLKGKKITGIDTWGKHFLILCEDITIRIHLMMFGTYTINERKSTPLKLRLSLEDTELNFYTCNVKLIEQDLYKFYNWSADIMSDKWDTSSAIKKMKEDPQLNICDALLDQNIFSGVGNIIKNEVLYRAKVQPQSTVGSIPLRKLKEIIAEARNYSFEFLKWKKENTLSRHWEVYSQKECPLKHKIQKVTVGKNKRRTFVCMTCQKIYT